MRKPGFVTPLREQLERVDPTIQQRVHRVGGLSDRELVSLTTRPDADPALYHPVQATEEDVRAFEVTLEDEAVGEQAVKNGEVAFVVLAGGAGTRAGGPKVFAHLKRVGMSLLAWKLLQAGNMPVWVMASPDMFMPIERHIALMALPAGMNGTIFEQFEGYRLTPDNQMSLNGSGVPELYPLGHGDVGPALVESKVLDENPQVKRIVVCNVDNVLASPDASVIGCHIRSGAKVSCELVPRQKGDRGGIPVWINDQLQVAEDFRLPEGFAAEARYHNTNTMVIDVDVLRYDITWRWHRVRKEVNNRIVVQHERLLQQYTEECAANFIVVPREARYQCVKTQDDLERADEFLASHRFR